MKNCKRVPLCKNHVPLQHCTMGPEAGYACLFSSLNPRFSYLFSRDVTSQKIPWLHLSTLQGAVAPPFNTNIDTSCLILIQLLVQYCIYILNNYFTIKFRITIQIYFATTGGARREPFQAFPFQLKKIFFFSFFFTLLGCG